MIEALMLCGIGLLAGCLLILLFFPPCISARCGRPAAIWSTAAPLTAKEGPGCGRNSRARCAGSSSIWCRCGRRRQIAPQIGRTRKSPASKSARPKEHIDPCVARATRCANRAPGASSSSCFIFFACSLRSRKVPQGYVALPQNVGEFEREPEANKLASTAAAIAAIGLKRRQAGSRR